jgi:hypothetical protein
MAKHRYALKEEHLVTVAPHGDAQFMLEIDIKSLVRLLAYRAYESTSGVATLAGGRIRVHAITKAISTKGASK